MGFPQQNIQKQIKNQQKKKHRFNFLTTNAPYVVIYECVNDNFDRFLYLIHSKFIFLSCLLVSPLVLCMSIFFVLAKKTNNIWLLWQTLLIATSHRLYFLSHYFKTLQLHRAFSHNFAI